MCLHGDCDGIYGGCVRAAMAGLAMVENVLWHAVPSYLRNIDGVTQVRAMTTAIGWLAFDRIHTWLVCRQGDGMSLSIRVIVCIMVGGCRPRRETSKDIARALQEHICCPNAPCLLCSNYWISGCRLT